MNKYTLEKNKERPITLPITIKVTNVPAGLTPPGKVIFSSDLPNYQDIGGGKKYTVPTTVEFTINFKAGGGEKVHWYFYNAISDTNNTSYTPTAAEIAAKVRNGWIFGEYLYDWYSKNTGVTFSADGIVKVNPADVSRGYKTTAFYAVASNAAGISCSRIVWLEFSTTKTSSTVGVALAPDNTNHSHGPSTSEAPVPEPAPLNVIRLRNADSVDADTLAIVSNDEYMIAAVLPVISADESRTYDLDVVLSDNVKAGAKMYWFAFPEIDDSDDDITAEFYDEE